MNANESIVNTKSGNAENKIHGRILPALKLARSMRFPITKSATILINFAARIISAIPTRLSLIILSKNSA